MIRNPPTAVYAVLGVDKAPEEPPAVAPWAGLYRPEAVGGPKSVRVERAAATCATCGASFSGREGKDAVGELFEHLAGSPGCNDREHSVAGGDMGSAERLSKVVNMSGGLNMLQQQAVRAAVSNQFSSVLGVAGTGKSHVAREVGRQIEAKYGEGAFIAATQNNMAANVLDGST